MYPLYCCPVKGVHITFGGAYFYGKKSEEKNKVYSAEYKICVIMDNAFIDELKRYIDYHNNERISLKLKGMSPVQYLTHSQAS